MNDVMMNTADYSLFISLAYGFAAVFLVGLALVSKRTQNQAKQEAVELKEKRKARMTEEADGG